MQSVEARFWVKVDRSAGLAACWPWTASFGSKGYGQFRLVPGQLGLEAYRLLGAHVVAYRLVHGCWPDPQALHGCDFRPCCNAENPEHVHEGTQADNMREMVERGRATNPAAWSTGRRSANAKLSNDQVRELRRLLGTMSQRILAVRFGISQQQVSTIGRGLVYQDVH